MENRFDQAALTWDEEKHRHVRAQAVAEQLVTQINLTPDMEVLEFGCGTGLLGFHLAPRVGSLTFADTSAGMLSQVEIKIDLALVQNAGTLLLETDQATLPQKFDGIVSMLTLHHIPDYGATIKMLTAHLKPGGWLGIADLDVEDGTFHSNTADTVHHGISRNHLKGIFAQSKLGNVQESTPFVIKKVSNGREREYPLFLLTGRLA
jgi:cyclopropane fatty-acyl-phospholipid synthase-like methyltransferase